MSDFVLAPWSAMSPDSLDAAVVRAAAQGDEPAFTRVFRAVQPVVLRNLRTLAGDAAEDLAAETWVHVIRGLPRFEGDESGFRAWVVTIARSRWVDHVRRAGRAPPRVSRSPPAGRRAGPHLVPAR